MEGFTLRIDKNSNSPIYIQLYERIKEEIISERLEKSAKIPSIRQMAAYLNISKTTIEAAYHQLYVEGYIESKPKSGYFVNYIGEHYAEIPNDIDAHYDKENNIIKDIRYDFRNDYVDKQSFDFVLWRRCLNKAINNEPDRFLTYGSHQGEYELRKEIAKYVHHSRGVMCSPEQVVIGAGVQSLLGILCGILREDFKTVAFEDPGFKQAQHIFSDHGYKITPISLEENGINIQRLWESSARMVYLSPSHQFPMGTVMSINKRIQLIRWAQEKKGLIIEDDYDSELRYYGRPIPSLQGLNKGKNVIYLGTFSKILLPSIRISYMILPVHIIERYFAKQKYYNQTSSQIEQLALALFIKEGLLEKHVRKLRKIYTYKNQKLIETIQREMHKYINIRDVETGLHILLELKTSLNYKEISDRAEKVGVRVKPIANYFTQDMEEEYPLVLLSYSGIALEDIAPAIQLLKESWFSEN